MVVSAREVERKYEVGAGFVVPDLGGLPGVREVTAPRELALAATYFDSADLRLAAGGVTLRRRTGGDDAGWHLKLPDGGDRVELRLPLAAADQAPPEQLRARVAGYLRGAEVVAVAELATRRVVRDLVGAAGQVLAEAADDAVTATVPAAVGGGTGVSVRSWREVEVELVGGDAALLAAAGQALRRAGARPSSSTSKLRRAVADRLPTAPGPGTAERGPGRQPTAALPDGSAGAAVLDHLSRQVTALAARVRAAWRRTRRAADRAAGAGRTGPAADTALHEVRKAAKRARYAAEAARPVAGKPARTFARRMKRLQQLLGDHQDAVITAAELRQLAVQAHLAGENGFTFGRLHARHQAAARRCRRRYPAAWRAAARNKHRRWLT